MRSGKSFPRVLPRRPIVSTPSATLVPGPNANVGQHAGRVPLISQCPLLATTNIVVAQSGSGWSLAQGRPNSNIDPLLTPGVPQSDIHHTLLTRFVLFVPLPISVLPFLSSITIPSLVRYCNINYFPIFAIANKPCQSEATRRVSLSAKLQVSGSRIEQPWRLPATLALMRQRCRKTSRITSIDCRASRIRYQTSL